MTDIENEVRQRLATDEHYPLGETDAMKWAVAFRQIRERNGNPPLDDGVMVGWFANAMATAEMATRGGSFLNADALQSIADGELDPHPEFYR